jgi:RHS repeat-associated protein
MYGPSGTTIEQINTENHVLYLHRDQQDSTRLITGESGKTEGAYTYSPYGVPEHTGTATTPLGYDAQYTSSDTGLIYLRARTYDPATGQFLSVDPLQAITRAPYNFAGDDPVNERDRTGLDEETVYCYPWGCFSAPGGKGGGPGQGVGEIIEKNWHEFEGGAEAIGKEAESIWNEISGQGDASHPLPPGYNPETWKKGPASRAKEPGENYYDPEGGEWHWHPPDSRHPEEHWDYKPPTPWNAEWEKIPCV